MPRITRNYVTKHRRRREQKTDYKGRLKLVKSGKLRAVIRKSEKNINIQFAEFKKEGDKILLGVNSKQLLKLGWKAPLGNLPAAYLTGLLAGKKAAKLGIKECILDIGMQASIKGSRLYSSLKGIIDAGIKIPCDKEILPSEDRISGKHIAEWKGGKFTKYGIKPEEIQKHFEEIKTKIKNSD